MLAGQGFRVALASDKRSLEASPESNDIRLIVLDVMLPDGSGLDICRDMRAGKLACADIGLEIDANDYLGKPFNPRGPRIAFHRPSRGP